jgi:uncharacterized metal-binding protein
MTPLRKLYGGTNRPHHLRLSRHVALVILTAGLFHWPHHADLVITAALACICQEGFSSADRDIEENRKPPSWYWLPYGRMVRHRSVWSHGLIIGTVVRLIYGWWWLLWPLWLVSPPMVWAWCGGALANDVAHLALDL